MATAAKQETLAAALVAAQAELHAPTKNRTVRVPGKYSFDYATLDSIIEMLRPVLTRHGLWFIQSATNGELLTRIIHVSGEHLDCSVPMPQLPAKPQEAGSLLTYFKRYSLCAAFGIAAEEDDDGTVASGQPHDTAPRAQNNNGKIDDAQWATIATLMQSKGVSAQRFCKKYQIQSVKELPSRLFKDAVDSLNAVEKEAA